MDNTNNDIARLQEEKKKIVDEIVQLQIDRSGLYSEITELKLTKIAEKEFVVNKSELLKAKTLVVFIKDRPMPLTMDNQREDFKGLKIAFTLDIGTGIERNLACYMYKDYNSPSNHLCEKYGPLINPTQEQIDDTIRKRLSELNFNDHQMTDVPEKYLSEAQIERRKLYNRQEKEKKIKEMETTIQKAQELIDKLSNSDD